MLAADEFGEVPAAPCCPESGDETKNTDVKMFCLQVCRGRVLDPLELELQTVVSWHVDPGN
uniref:RAD50 interactor 1 n=1 Tax=Mus spicilegus TaxID=10103 RepID=A0A8C6I1X3_MUSSI